MNRKIRIDQALDYILEPGSDSELSELSDSESEEEPTLQPPRIQDDEIEDTNANTNDPSGESENEESMSHLPDETNERNHVFRWRSSKPSSGDYLFKGKSLTVPYRDYDETSLTYFKMFWNDELSELIAEKTNIYSSQKLGKTIQVTKEEIEQFISIQMYMFILKLPAYHLYWSKEMRYAPNS